MRTAIPGCARRSCSCASCSSGGSRRSGSASPAAAGGRRRRRPPAAAPEIGWYEIELTAEAGSDPLLGELPERFEGFQYHHYEWLLLPEATVLARSPACLQAFRLDGLPAWGVQFHPEVTLADLRSWLDHWESDPAAVASGLDPKAISAESAGKIGAWNDLGQLSASFFEHAAGRRGRRSPESVGVSRGARRYSGVTYAPESPPSTRKVWAVT